MLSTTTLAPVWADSAAPSATQPPPPGPGERPNPYRLLDQVGRVLHRVELDYFEPADRSAMVEGALSGMVDALDPHSAYLPAQDFNIFRGDTEGRFGGIGVEVDFDEFKVTIIAPVEGSPADRAGVLPGDQIVAIDGRPVRGTRPDRLVKTMRGKPGTVVKISVKRSGESKLLQFALTREVISVASVASKLLDGDVAYIRIKSFQQGTHQELLEAIGALRREAGGSLEGLILDLRNNPGGLVNEATAVADELLPGGVIFTTRHRGRVVREARARRSGVLTRGPAVVLINEFSASAAELVAGALKDHYRAHVVGTRSFGKGSVQSILSLPEGAGLKLTTALYFTPRGHAIQAQGVEPDVVVEPGYVAERDYQVMRERDLEGHIPSQPDAGAETPAARAETVPEQGAREQPSEETPTSVPTLHLGVSRDVPRNPVGGPDFALSIGYQIVRGILTRRD